MMRVTLWGTRGSLATPGPETARYGGNTSCVQVEGDDGTVLVLDAGTGIRRLGTALPRSLHRIDILLTHLHLDHILGLGFFDPLFASNAEVHIWGPASTTVSLEDRLMRYLSPPLFPLHLRELSRNLTIHEVACDEFGVGRFEVHSAPVCHPGPTVGFRIQPRDGGCMAYIPDHEPALGVIDFPLSPEWTSGHEIAEGVDLLIHDSQFGTHEYEDKQGWGHSTVEQALVFGALCQVKEFVSFHYDPGHDDAEIDRLMREAEAAVRPGYRVTAGLEGAVYTVG